jgi:hypothetical protein
VLPENFTDEFIFNKRIFRARLRFMTNLRRQQFKKYFWGQVYQCKYRNIIQMGIRKTNPSVFMGTVPYPTKRRSAQSDYATAAADHVFDSMKQ